VATIRHGLRHAVQQEHRLAGAIDRVVDLHAVDLGLAVREPGSGEVSEVHLGELLPLFGRVGADPGWWIFLTAISAASSCPQSEVELQVTATQIDAQGQP
jgi:hypothetical protein